MKKIIQFVTLILILAIATIYLLPALAAVREHNRRAKCVGNVAEIGKLVTAYSRTHNGQLPARFEQLGVSVSNADLRIFLCSGNRGSPGATYNISDWTDYVLVTNTSSASPSNAPLVCCGVETPKGASVFHMDGSASWENWFEPPKR